MNELLQNSILPKAPLGQKTTYPREYDRSLLFPVERKSQREVMGFPSTLPFFGSDIWNAYELSFLNKKNKPIRKILTLSYSSSSPFIVESKSLKLYLNSLNQTSFIDEHEVLNLIKKDISDIVGIKADITFYDQEIAQINGKLDDLVCLDEQDVEIKNLFYDKSLLKILNGEGNEKLYTHIFKSHCLVTSQPDFASVFIEYEGQKLCHEGLLKYLVSFNNHQGFSENVIEQIFIDIYELIKPKNLTIYGRFTRRGGIDINPYRSTKKSFAPFNQRLIFQ